MRDSKITTWLTADEKEKLQLDAGCKTVSNYTRDLLIGSPPRPIVPTVNQQHWGELARVVGNLNQLTQAVNRGIIPSSAELTATLATLLGAVKELRNSLRGKEV